MRKRKKHGAFILRVIAAGLVIGALAVSIPRALHAGAMSARAGAWDFTDTWMSDRYRTLPSFVLAYTFFDRSLFSVEIASGAAYTSVEFNSNQHNLWLVPTTVSYLINIRSRRSPMEPYVGAGIGGYYKRDENTTADTTRSHWAYGYCFLTGFKISMESGLFFYFDIRYHLVMAHNVDELNMSGINAALGIGYAFEWL